MRLFRLLQRPSFLAAALLLTAHCAVLADEPPTDPLSALCKQLRDAGYREASPENLASQKIHSLIATITDPERTNLALLFDRSIEAIIWGVSDVGYTLQGYWLPWKPEAPEQLASALRLLKTPELSKLAKQLGTARQTSSNGYEPNQPGFLLFLPSPGASIKSGLSDLLVVWLVGESPTTGIETDALDTAIANVRKYGNDPKGKIRILGPTFSGGFRSLASTLKFASSKPTDEFSVRSGTTESLPAQEDFLKRLGTDFEEDSQAKDPFFRTTVENTDYALSRFIEYMAEHTSERGEIAILSEDQTAFGQTFSKTMSIRGRNVLSIRFPREIAHLRNLYEPDATKATITPGESAPLPSTTPAFTLKSNAESQDNVPSFSKEQGPLSQDGVLLQIAALMQQEGVRYAGIVATDTLDAIFLTRFLRSACSDVRVFVFGTDVLFVRAEIATPLAGALAITSYPLFGRNQHWTAHERQGEPPRRIAFSSFYEEGLYNATRAQLNAAGMHGFGEPLLDYIRPDASSSKEPPLWLTVLGNSGYWPVALLDDTANSKGRSVLSAEAFDLRSQGTLDPGPGSRSWWLIVVSVTFLAILHCLFIELIYLHPRPEPRKGASLSSWQTLSVFVFRFFGAYPRTPATTPETRCLALFPTLLFTLALMVLATSGLPYARIRGPWLPVTLFCFMLIPFAFTVVVALQLTVRNKQHGWLLGAWAAFALFASLWAASTDLPDIGNDNRVFFFAYRMLYPTSGVSPALPILFLLATVFFWAFAHLWRDAGRHPPHVPAFSETVEDVKRLNQSLAHLSPLSAGHFAALLVLVAVITHLLAPVRSVESKSYDFLVTMLAALCWGMTLAAWLQVLSWWWDFRRVLQSLERHKIRDAFSRLPKELGKMPVFRRAKYKPQLLASARCSDILDGIVKNSVINADPDASQYKTLRQDIHTAVVEFMHLLNERADEDPWACRSLQESGKKLRDFTLKTSNALIHSARNHFWDQGASESLDAEREKLRKRRHLSEEEIARVLVEEFIALRFVMYIRTIFDQMRKLMWFVVAGFVLTVLALTTYPFKSPRLIDFLATAIFILIAVGTAIALAQMDRDPILSRLTATRPNEISFGYYTRLGSFLALPLLTVLSTQFPTIRAFLFSWIQPALKALTSSG